MRRTDELKASPPMFDSPWLDRFTRVHPAVPVLLFGPVIVLLLALGIDRAGFWNSVGLVLQKYKQTLVDVYGHTDSTGNDEHNFDLSQRRALSVANYLSAQGVDSRRFAVTGFGETKPIASNATAQGRAANRRVEIQLTPLTQQ